MPLVCIPAGTRNHFALDLGLDRDDVVGALDAFGEAVERRIDLATVGDRVFVNNVSLGVYAKIVQSDGVPRREARRPPPSSCPSCSAPTPSPSTCASPAPTGPATPAPSIIQVSNNPYVLTRLGGFGTRARLDTGELGVVTAEVHGAADVAQLVAAEAAGRIQRFRGYLEWATPEFVVDSDTPSRPASTARRSASTRPCSSARCPARCGSASRRMRPVGPPPPSPPHP